MNIMNFQKVPLRLVYPKLHRELSGCVNFNARRSLMAVYSTHLALFTVMVNTKEMIITGYYIKKTASNEVVLQ